MATGRQPTDMLPLPDCVLCGGTGLIKEQRPNYWGLAAYEWVICDCIDDNEAPLEGCCCEVKKTVTKCQQCDWTGDESKLIAPFSDWEPVCPDCWSGDFLDTETDCPILR